MPVRLRPLFGDILRASRLGRGAATLAVVAGVLPAGAGGAPGGAAAGADERGGVPDAAWRLAPLWDDGQAEFAAYEVTWRRYGRLYPGRALVVLVKEPWAPDLDVKADRPRPDGFDVLKLNLVRDVPTGIYTYHQMASVYFRRDTAALVKVATTSMEACGIATALLRSGRLETHSYFDDEGDRHLDFPAGAIPEDALPALLRDYVRGEPPEELSIFPLLLMGRFVRLEPEVRRVRKQPLVQLQVPAGTFDAVEITLEGASSTQSYAFEAASPHRLLRYRDAEGSEYRLAKAERLVYWRLHAPGDDAWWPASLRMPVGPPAPAPEGRP